MTVDDIAAEADVSRRTFFRYFASKEDVLLADHLVQLARLREAMADRPADEPIVTALRNALLSMTGDFEDRKEMIILRGRLMRDTPSLQARSLVHQRLWEDRHAGLWWPNASASTRSPTSGPASCRPPRWRPCGWPSPTGSAAGCDGDLIALTTEALDLLDGGLQQLHDHDD